MSAALQVRLDHGSPRPALLDEGKVLLAEHRALGVATEALGVTPLECFDAYAELDLPADFDGDPDELADLQEEAEPSWFDPRLALETVRALEQAPLSKLDRFAEPEVRAALGALRETLEGALAQGARFHFELDL
ncbi:MAG: hypothetical protein VYE22_32890 [Myxococcota bacterium]|nr:hypothetical protein [Myxococcota bacterium]